MHVLPDLAARLRRLARRSAVVLAPLALAPLALGCGDDSTGETVDDIVNIANSSVKNQSIGNCWIYATFGWAESLELHFTGVEANYSESYASYMHWYEQIVGPLSGMGSVGSIDSAKNELNTGGWYGVAAELIRRWGLLDEGHFIPEEAESARSARQSSALRAINDSLKTGALSEPAARRDRKLVRQELDRAWGLTDDVKALLDEAFGEDMTRTFARGDATPPEGSHLLRASEVSVGQGISLADAIGQPRSNWDVKGRTGTYAWTEHNYPSAQSSRRQMQIRAQAAMHDGMPLIMTWFVDFAALNSQSEFRAPPETPGRQGGHMTVVADYQINDVPGYGTLEAGVLVEDEEALAAALSPEARIEFIRIKNSWGTSLAPPGAPEDQRGYHDLYMEYLDGPLVQCTERDGDACGSKRNTAGLWGFVLPTAAFVERAQPVTVPECRDLCQEGPVPTAECATDCIEFVIEYDDYCGSVEWDDICLNYAIEVCPEAELSCGTGSE